MPRTPRCFPEGHSVHVIQRGNNRARIFVSDRDRRKFLGKLAASAEECHVDIHAFTLMDNHVHVLATPEDEQGLPHAMQKLDGSYTLYFNRKYGRTGTLWEGRYDAFDVADERYWLTCLRYIEQNPQRAGMVNDPREHMWSSYRAHALGDDTFPWLRDHWVYLRLGETPAERQHAYRAICGVKLDETELRLVRRPPRRDEDGEG